jgi:AraC family transcriptional regulator, regulatory protein of adaptative response / DNA-3-methyladenine glycosylase II
VIMAAALLIGGLALSMIMNAKWQLWLGLGIVLGVASGLTSLVLATNIATAPNLFSPSQTLEDAIAKLRSIRGIAEWTAQYIAMRVLREPDAFPAADIGLLRALIASRGRPAQLR